MCKVVHGLLQRLPTPVKVICEYLLSQWFILGLGLAVGLAAAFPHVGMSNGPLKAQYTVEWGGIGLIFLITGVSISENRCLVKKSCAEEVRFYFELVLRHRSR